MSTNKPWESEPNHGSFEAHGRLCWFRRNTMTGTLNGYVSVPAKVLPVEVEFLVTPDFEVHGGITYEAVEGDKMVWGFDCCHGGVDFIPYNSQLLGPLYEDPSRLFERPTYKDVNFVKSQCAKLAEQINHWLKTGDERCKKK